MTAFDCDICGAANERCGCAQDQTALRWDRDTITREERMAQFEPPYKSVSLIMQDGSRRQIGLGNWDSPAQALDILPTLGTGQVAGYILHRYDPAQIDPKQVAQTPLR